MKTDKIITLYDVVLFFPHATDTLDRHNLDYFCNGAKPFLDACHERQLDAAVIWEEVLKKNGVRHRWAQSWKEWEPGILSDVILRHYNDLSAKVLSANEVLDQIARECVEKEGSKILRIHACFKDLCDELERHMITEEKTLLNPLRKNRDDVDPLSGTRTHGLDRMEAEHLDIGNKIKTLRQLTDNYALKDLTSPLAPLAGIMLQGFDKELTQRLHLENNILFPKLRKLNGGYL